MLHRPHAILALLPVAAILLASCGRTAQPFPAATANNPAEVEAAIDAHWEAIRTGELAAIESAHLPEITVFLTETANRLEWGTPETEAVLAPLLEAQSDWTARDFDIQFVGDAAIASFYLDGSNTFADGRVDARTRRVTAVWVKQADGSWRELHHHDSVAAPE